jgi:hypothetical protein
MAVGDAKDTGLPPATRDPDADTTFDGVEWEAPVVDACAAADDAADAAGAAEPSPLLPAIIRFNFSSRASASRTGFFFAAVEPDGPAVLHDEMGGKASAAASSSAFCFASASAAALEARVPAPSPFDGVLVLNLTLRPPLGRLVTASPACRDDDMNARGLVKCPLLPRPPVTRPSVGRFQKHTLIRCQLLCFMSLVFPLHACCLIV